MAFSSSSTEEKKNEKIVIEKMFETKTKNKRNWGKKRKQNKWNL